MAASLQTIIGPMLLVATMRFTIAEDARAGEVDKSPSRFEYLQIRMAIPVRITVYAADEAIANQAANRAYARFKELDRLLSDYDPDSELSKLCGTARPGQSLPVSHELWTVLSHAREVSRQSEGAFDVTVGPLTDLWRKSRRRQHLPSDEERLAALERVGWQHVQLSQEDRRVGLQVPGMQLDLGGIAKGYAADEAVRVMAETGVTRTLVDAGGDIVVGDPPPDASAWRIGIAPIDDARGSPNCFVRLKNASIATSGDAAQHVEIDGVRYSHIVDPKTGLGVTTPSSVTVIAPDGISADSLASAVSVLGPQQGIELIEQIDGTEAVVVTRSRDGQLLMRMSSGFQPYLVAAPSD